MIIEEIRSCKIQFIVSVDFEKDEVITHEVITRDVKHMRRFWEGFVYS